MNKEEFDILVNWMSEPKQVRSRRKADFLWELLEWKMSVKALYEAISELEEIYTGHAAYQKQKTAPRSLRGESGAVVNESPEFEGGNMDIASKSDTHDAK